MTEYDPADHYWIVAGDETKLFSSKSAGYVDADAAAYKAWLAVGRAPTRIASEGELWDVLIAQAPQCLPDDATAQDRYKEARLDAADMVQFKIAFNHENRVRALEGKSPVTAAQFRSGVKALL